MRPHHRAIAREETILVKNRKGSCGGGWKGAPQGGNQTWNLQIVAETLEVVAVGSREHLHEIVLPSTFREIINTTGATIRSFCGHHAWRAEM